MTQAADASFVRLVLACQVIAANPADASLDEWVEFASALDDAEAHLPAIVSAEPQGSA